MRNYYYSLQVFTTFFTCYYKYVKTYIQISLNLDLLSTGEAILRYPTIFSHFFPYKNSVKNCVQIHLQMYSIPCDYLLIMPSCTYHRSLIYDAIQAITIHGIKTNAISRHNRTHAYRISPDGNGNVSPCFLLPPIYSRIVCANHTM